MGVEVGFFSVSGLGLKDVCVKCQFRVEGFFGAKDEPWTGGISDLCFLRVFMWLHRVLIGFTFFCVIVYGLVGSDRIF